MTSQIAMTVEIRLLIYAAFRGVCDTSLAEGHFISLTIDYWRKRKY